MLFVINSMMLYMIYDVNETAIKVIVVNFKLSIDCNKVHANGGDGSFFCKLIIRRVSSALRLT